MELCVYLCKLFDLTEKHIICHYEGYQQGLATPHIDPTHWFPKFGKTMDDFRAAVRAGLEEEEPMTQGTFDQLMASWLARNNPGYKTLADVPAYWQAETKALQEAGAIRGSGSAELDISRETLKAAVICKRYLDAMLQKEKAFGHDIWLISDEPYREIAFDGREVPYASRFYPRTISCYSFSKSLSIPGERIGYVAVNPESGVSAMLVNMCGQISRGIGHNCPSSVIQLAAADCCDLTSDLSVYETNMNLLYDALTALGFDVVRPGGTFYLFPKALESDAAAFSRKALPYGLILVPSDSFGLPGYFRIAFCTDTEKVVRSIDAFKAFVKAEY